MRLACVAKYPRSGVSSCCASSYVTPTSLLASGWALARGLAAIFNVTGCFSAFRQWRNTSFGTWCVRTGNGHVLSPCFSYPCEAWASGQPSVWRLLCTGPHGQMPCPRCALSSVTRRPYACKNSMPQTEPLGPAHSQLRSPQLERVHPWPPGPETTQ